MTPQRGGSAGTQAAIGVAVLVIIIGSFMSFLDSTIVNVAIPTLQAQFGASPDQIDWVVTVYLLVTGVCVPISGWLADRYGMSRVYQIALIIFTAGSALSGLSWSVGSLVFFRALQAVGGGLLGPITMAMIYRIVPRDRIGTWAGVFGITIALAPAIGPTLGGYLVEYIDWRLIFYVNVPIGVIAILLAFFVLPPLEGERSRPFDLWGFVTSASGLAMLLYALNEGASWGWTSESIILMIVGAIWLIVMFIIIELHTPEPLLDLNVFRNRTFSLTSIMIPVIVTCLYSGTYYVPLYMQTVQGQGAMVTGLTLMPAAIMMGTLMPIAGRLYDKVGARLPAVIGMAIMTTATLLLRSIGPETSRSTIMVMMMLRETGVGLTMMPTMTAGLSVIPTKDIGRASAINNIIQRTAASFGLASLTSVFTGGITAKSSQLAWTLTPFSHGFASLTQALATPAAQLTHTAAARSASAVAGLAISQVIFARAYTDAVRDVWLWAAVSAAIGFGLAWMLKEQKHPAAAAGAGHPAVME